MNGKMAGHKPRGPSKSRARNGQLAVYNLHYFLSARYKNEELDPFVKKREGNPLYCVWLVHFVFFTRGNTARWPFSSIVNHNH